MPLREVKVNLDTLWVDADALQLVLVWRARIDPRPGDARVLLVEGHHDATTISPDTFRPVLLRLDAEEAEAAQAEEDLHLEEPEEEEPEVTRRRRRRVTDSLDTDDLKAEK